MKKIDKKRMIVNLIVFFSIMSEALGGTRIVSFTISYAGFAIIIGYICLILCLKGTLKFSLFDVIFIMLNFILIIIAHAPNMIFPSILLLIYKVICKFSEEIDYRETLTLFSWISGITFLMILLANQIFGFNGTSGFEMWRIDQLIRRYSLGFFHPNAAMIFFLGGLFAVFARITSKKQIYKTVVLSSITMFIVGQLTQSRTTIFIFLMMSFIIILLKKKIFKESRLISHFIIFLYPLLFCISLWVLLTPLNPRLDDLLSGRQTLYHVFLSQSGFTLFGYRALENAMFDNAYLQMLLARGILYTILFFIIVIKILISRKNKDILSSMLIAMLFLVGVTETVFSKFMLWTPLLLALQCNELKEVNKS